METLREITIDYHELLNEALYEEEIREETLEKLKNIDSKFDEKIGNMAQVIKELESKCLIVNEEIDRLNQRVTKWYKNIKRIQEYMKGEMVFIGKEKIDTPMYTVSIRRSELTEVDKDFLKEAKEKNLYKLLRRIPEKIEPDKKEIKEYIKAGNQLNHARIVKKENLSIR